MWNLRKKAGFSLITLALLGSMGNAKLFAQEQAIFTVGPNMVTERMAQFIVPIANNIEVIGGHGNGFTALNSAEKWDKTSNTFTFSTMNYTHDIGALVQISDGQWLIAGGAENLGVAPGYKGAELFNPTTGTFTVTGSMVYPRTGNIAVLLDENRSLMVGGWYNNDSTENTEIYNAATGTFSVSGKLEVPRSYPWALPTSDGKAVVFWGMPPYGGTPYDSVELYDPDAKTFTILSDTMLGESGWLPIINHLNRPMSLQKMNDGKYLLWAYKDNNVSLITFDPESKTFSKLTTSPSIPFFSEEYPMDVLVDNKNNRAYILALKRGTTTDVLTVYVVDLIHNTLTKALPSYTLPDNYHLNNSANIVLEDGRILITGGFSETGYNTNFSPVNKTLFIELKSTAVISPILYLLL